ncbi:hypothetical protein BDR05DRAFT_977793 [Suillus weaverae]|nr:hypothetical protein BDR05DRAFT_977793 [Suillus weaverae]
MALAQSDIPWLKHLLQTLICNGASIHTIPRKIEEALECGYCPRGHSSKAYDLALLISRIGGGSLLFALGCHMCIPSLHSLHSNLSFIVITLTIGLISSEMIGKNIVNVAIEPHYNAGLIAHRGVSLLTDEVALEEAAVYFPDCNSVGGLCWKHLHTIDASLNTYKSTINIAEKLKTGDVHLRKEMTVIVAHCFGEDGIYPLLAAPTCKTEDAADWEFIFTEVIEMWYRHGTDEKVGPVWSFATNGDATRRKAGHKMFVKFKLKHTSPLYSILSNLPGLNLYTCSQSITLDFDYKHIFKHNVVFIGFCTLLCSTAGVYLNNGRCINSKMLKCYLSWLDGVDELKARKLLFPDDPQDDPRAVELMSAIIQLGTIDPTQPPFTDVGSPPDVNIIADFEAIKLLSHLLKNLLEPFINVELSLSEQVSHLSALAHMLFTLY